MANRSARAIERLHKARNYKLVPFVHQVATKAAPLTPTRTGRGSPAGKPAKPDQKFVHVSRSLLVDGQGQFFLAPKGTTYDIGRNAMKRANRAASKARARA